jgi:hypothetical protein
MKPAPINDGLFASQDSLIKSYAWRKWFVEAASVPVVLESKPLLTNLALGALEFYDNGNDGHLYITMNVSGVLTRVEIV